MIMAGFKFSHMGPPPHLYKHMYRKAERIGCRTKYKPEYCQLMIDMMSEGKSYAAFLVAVDVIPSTALKWFVNYPEFREAKDKAILASLAYWENIGERASRGELPGANANLYKFIIKNRFPNVYRDIQEVKKEINVKFETTVNELGQIEQRKEVEAADQIIDITDNDVTTQLTGNTEE